MSSYLKRWTLLGYAALVVCCFVVGSNDSASAAMVEHDSSGKVIVNVTDELIEAYRTDIQHPDAPLTAIELVQIADSVGERIDVYEPENSGGTKIEVVHSTYDRQQDFPKGGIFVADANSRSSRFIDGNSFGRLIRCAKGTPDAFEFDDIDDIVGNRITKYFIIAQNNEPPGSFGTSVLASVRAQGFSGDQDQPTGTDGWYRAALVRYLDGANGGSVLEDFVANTVKSALNEGFPSGFGTMQSICEADGSFVAAAAPANASAPAPAPAPAKPSAPAPAKPSAPAPAPAKPPAPAPAKPPAPAPAKPPAPAPAKPPAPAPAKPPAPAPAKPPAPAPAKPSAPAPAKPSAPAPAKPSAPAPAKPSAPAPAKPSAPAKPAAQAVRRLKLVLVSRRVVKHKHLQMVVSASKNQRVVITFTTTSGKKKTSIKRRITLRKGKNALKIKLPARGTHNITIHDLKKTKKLTFKIKA